MSDYTKSTDFAAKDNLTTGDPGKKILGADLETEFDAIATAIASKADTSEVDLKADLATPTFTGDVTITSGDVVVSSGNGIDFAAVGSGSVLDYYKEANFTPTLVGSTSSAGITYTTQNGRYTRIGNMCFFSVHIVLSSRGSASGTVSIGNLPFTSAATVNWGGHAFFSDEHSITSGFTGRIVAGGTEMDLYYLSTGGDIALPVTQLGSLFHVEASGFYRVA